MDIDQRLIETYVLFQRHVFLLESHHKTKKSVLDSFLTALEKNKDSRIDEILKLYNYVILFVDLAVRIQKLAHALPRINHRSKEYRQFDDRLGELKDLRNRFQHINNEIDVDGHHHLLGAISFYADSRLYCVAFQDISRTRKSATLPFEITDEQKLKINHEFGYVLENKTFDIDKIYEACCNLAAHLESQINLVEDGGNIDIKTKYDIWAVDLIEDENGVSVRLA
jgi:hypothetical protein